MGPGVAGGGVGGRGSNHQIGLSVCCVPDYDSSSCDSVVSEEEMTSQVRARRRRGLGDATANDTQFDTVESRLDEDEVQRHFRPIRI